MLFYFTVINFVVVVIVYILLMTSLLYGFRTQIITYRKCFRKLLSFNIPWFMVFFMDQLGSGQTVKNLIQPIFINMLFPLMVIHSNTPTHPYTTTPHTHLHRFIRYNIWQRSVQTSIFICSPYSTRTQLNAIRMKYFRNIPFVVFWCYKENI